MTIYQTVQSEHAQGKGRVENSEVYKKEKKVRAQDRAFHITSSIAWPLMKTTAFSMRKSFHTAEPGSNSAFIHSRFMSRRAKQAGSALKGKSIDPMGGKIQPRGGERAGRQHCGDHCSVSYRQSAPLSADQPAKNNQQINEPGTARYARQINAHSTFISTPIKPIFFFKSHLFSDPQIQP